MKDNQLKLTNLECTICHNQNCYVHIIDLNNVLDLNLPRKNNSYQKLVAQIDEEACIGCTKCIKACPVDSIIGTNKYMHTIITDECTGCALCLEPCPVDCIDLVPSNLDFLPKNSFLANTNNEKINSQIHAKIRFEYKNLRLKTDNKITNKIQKNKKSNSTTINNNLDIKSLLNQAKEQAMIKTKKGRTVIYDDELKKELIEKEKNKSLNRKLNILNNKM